MGMYDGFRIRYTYNNSNKYDNYMDIYGVYIKWKEITKKNLK